MMQEEKAGTQSPSPTAPMFEVPLAVGRAKKQIEIGKVAHDRLLTGSQEVLDRWFERRRRTSEALASFSRDIIAAKSPQEVMKAWADWSSGSMDRLVEDAKDQLSAGASAVRHLASGTTALAQTVPVGADGRSTRDVDSVRTQKPSETHVRH